MRPCSPVWASHTFQIASAVLNCFNRIYGVSFVYMRSKLASLQAVLSHLSIIRSGFHVVLATYFDEDIGWAQHGVSCPWTDYLCAHAASSLSCYPHAACNGNSHRGTSLPVLLMTCRWNMLFLGSRFWNSLKPWLSILPMVLSAEASCQAFAPLLNGAHLLPIDLHLPGVRLVDILQPPLDSLYALQESS